MADRNSNNGGRSDESQNPDLGRDEESGMGGSGSDRGGEADPSGDTPSDNDTSGGSGSDRGNEGNDEIGDENVSSR